jgi:hypothetical protein
MVQLYVAPATLLFNDRAVLVPEHIVVIPVKLPTGAGFTVTAMLIGEPGHEFAVGVTVYVTIPGLVLDALSVCAIEFPEPGDEPVAKLSVELQEKVVPDTVLVNTMEVVFPEQIEVGPLKLVTGFGFTVTVMVIGEPGQPFAVGVTV